MADGSSVKPRGRPFPKSVSGNPKGRPKGSRNKTLVALDEMGEAAAHDVLERVLHQATMGIEWAPAAKMILSRVWAGPKGRTVEFELPPIDTLEDLPKAMAKLIAAVANGEITVEDAKTVAGLIDTQRVVLMCAKPNG